MEMPGFATPGNTVGMGNPAVPGENGEVGSGDMVVTASTNPKKPKKKKMKSLKDYLKEKK